MKCREDSQYMGSTAEDDATSLGIQDTAQYPDPLGIQDTAQYPNHNRP